MRTIDKFFFKDKKALVRVDFNVPLDAQFNVTDDTRIRITIPTLKKILDEGGSVILMSHLGRPKNGPENKFSLKHIIKTIENLLRINLKFADDCIGNAAQKISAELKPGEALMLENLRFYKEEEKGNEAFARKLSQLGSFYVNDAFGTAHRAHASTAVIAKFFPDKKCFGYVMSRELENINRVLNGAQKPFTAIIGGAKVSDKILILEQLLNKADNILIGGGMAFTFAKSQGGNIGKSMVEDDKLDIAKNILTGARERNVNIFIPVDAIIADNFSNDANRKSNNIKNIPDGWMGLDIGKETEKIYTDVISKSQTILWNGPMGVFEMSNFEHGTKSVAAAVADATAKGAYSLIGGGDSVAAINKYNLAKKVSYLSTGGGALLEYMESGTLPGVEAIEK